MYLDLLKWTEEVYTKLKSSNSANLALAIEVVGNQKHALIIHPKEDDFNDKQLNLKTYCDNHQVLAMVWVSEEEGKRVFYRKILTEEFKQI